MSFLTGKDWTPKFAGQVVPDLMESKTPPINNASVVNLLYASQPTHSGESLFEVGFDEIWLQSQGDLLRGIANIMSENRESNLVYFCSLPT